MKITKNMCMVLRAVYTDWRAFHIPYDATYKFM
jgi:hypothetical protein